MQIYGRYGIAMSEMKATTELTDSQPNQSASQLNLALELKSDPQTDYFSSLFRY